MVVTGRFVAFVAVGVVPVVVFGALAPSAAGPVLVAWLLLCIAVVVVDALLAPRPSALKLSRVLPARVRLGESVTAELVVTNTGRRRLRGVLRDAWQPSAGASPPAE